MLITIQQVRASGKNLFQVLEEGRVLFKAQTPWMRISAPFDAERLRALNFTDFAGNEIFHTDYRVLDNALEDITRYKYLFGAVTKLGEYQIVGRDGNTYGSFYTQLDGAFSSQMTIDFLDRSYECYLRYLGKVLVISIYNGERQIAQVTKPLDVCNRLDVYYLHLDDSFRNMLPILSFFVIYVDAMNFNCPGQFGYSIEKNRSYSFNKNNDRYDPDWISKTFGQEAAEQLGILLKNQPVTGPNGPEQTKRMNRQLIAISAVAALTAIILISVLVWLALRPADILLPGEFYDLMQSQGYTVSEAAPAGLGDSWEYAYEAEKGEQRLYYMSFPSDKEAKICYKAAKLSFSLSRSSPYSETSIDLIKTNKYALSCGGEFFQVSRVGNTVILYTGPEWDKLEVKELFKNLGY